MIGRGSAINSLVDSGRLEHEVLEMKLGSYQETIYQAIDKLAQAEVVERIWRQDFTVWRPDPEEISNRLGWLTIPARMRDQLPALNQFAQDLYGAGFRRAVLLGMGGSSLAPEVFSETFGVAEGRLDLAVLDSTDPAVISRLSQTLDYQQTLFIVATKSGTTVETLSFFKYFYNQAQAKLGTEQAGQHFVAITDPGTQLVELADQFDFRRTFENDPNIGGRYSALSFFGLVPAALVGVDLEKLVKRSLKGAEACGDNGSYQDNPAVALGAAMGELAKVGRNKLTLILSPGIKHFGDWLEQLIAESTGKEGVGIVPVVGEALGKPEDYRDDRFFVQLQVAGDDRKVGQLAELAELGHPTVHISLDVPYDLGEQMFVWEMATAIAGRILDINPFNQPNVESAKKRAKQMVATFQESGELPDETPAWGVENLEIYWGAPQDDGEVTFENPADGLTRLLDSATSGSYFGLQAYLPSEPAIETILRQLQASLRDKTGRAVTLGYGPRFLHSTGQLHKGDGGEGLFMQLTSAPTTEVPIPEKAGEQGSILDFGVLIQAQALGDRKALVEADRKVLRVEIMENIKGGLRKILALVDELASTA